MYIKYVCDIAASSNNVIPTRVHNKAGFNKLSYKQLFTTSRKINCDITLVMKNVYNLKYGE